jgi:hypothetical protein
MFSFIDHSQFFDKGNILILRRFQLHLASTSMQCPSGITDAYIEKEEKELQKEKSRYLIALVQTTPR